MPRATRGRTRRVVARAALVLVSVALGGFAVELAVRAALDVYRCDEKLGWTFAPNRNGFKINRESRSLLSVRLDEYGFRGEGHSLEKPLGVHRTMILGDSFTAGLHVAEEDAFPHRIETSLNAQSDGTTRFEVINAGVPGYSTAQELAQFREVGWKFQPDLVVLAVYLGNDISNNSIRAVPCHYLVSVCGRPFFEMRDGRLVSVADGEPQRVAPEGWLDRILGSSLIYRNLLHGMQAPVSEEPPEGNEIYGIESNTRGFPSWVTTMELVIQIKKAVEVYGIPFVVLLIPTGPEVVPSPLTAAFELLRGRFIDFLTAHDIPFIDPLDALLRSQAAGRPPYYVSDHHWNEIGHAQAADSVGAYFAARCEALGIPVAHCAGRAPGDF